MKQLTSEVEFFDGPGTNHPASFLQVEVEDCGADQPCSGLPESGVFVG